MSSQLKQFYQERKGKTVIEPPAEKYPPKWEVRRMTARIDRRH